MTRHIWTHPGRIETDASRYIQSALSRPLLITIRRLAVKHGGVYKTKRMSKIVLFPRNACFLVAGLSFRGKIMASVNGTIVVGNKNS